MQERHMTPAWMVLAMAAMTGTAALGADAPACHAQSGAMLPQVVELYTSEGCNSCPPADRWLSSLANRSDVIAVAFHVDYWDRLGWRDRFANARFTERQAQAQAHSGARFSYTPQVLVGGRDWRRWPDLPPASQPSRVNLSLQRPGAQVVWRVEPLPGAPATLALWWAALEDGHRSDVQAGENAGVTLRHDHVVRHYGQEAPWSGAMFSRFDVPSRGEGGRPLRVVAVVTDTRTGLPVQAVQLRCAD
jgi:hypothetical protein